jgi:hypothetical protein
MVPSYGVNLLAYALPVLRLLGLHQIEVPFPDTPLTAEEARPLGCTPPPAGGLPEGLSSLLRQACREMKDGHRQPGPSLLINVPGGSYSLEGLEGGASLAIPPSRENDESAPDRALGELLRSLQDDESGHLVVADWLEEWLGPCPSAAALRASTSQSPGPLESNEKLVFHSFGWRWLDRGVVLYLTGVLRRDSTRRRCVRAGFLIGLLYRPDSAPHRWVRWLPVAAAEAVRPLARELGVELIE